MMITEQKFYWVSCFFAHGFLAQTRTSLGRKQWRFTICLFIYHFFFVYCLGGMIGHGWESCHFIFYAFAIIYLGGIMASLDGLFISPCRYFLTECYCGLQSSLLYTMGR
ncbi:hypothetical protein J3E69DRAFT_110359 [Trichoderma sp. SZMC 28015]